MTVRISYGGRFGNNMFQYAYARLLAETNGLDLETAFPHQDVIRMEPHRPGSRMAGPEIYVGETNVDPPTRPRPPGNYRVHGWFQNSGFYWEARDAILGFAKPVPQEPMPDGEIVAHCRLEDYHCCKIVIHPSWYRKILAGEKFDRLHVVTQEMDRTYLDRAFGDFNPVIVSSTLANDWNYLRRFRRIILSNSTMAWWAAFFGLADRVFVFKRWITNPGAQLTEFPSSVPVDGPFFHENP